MILPQILPAHSGSYQSQTLYTVLDQLQIHLNSFTSDLAAQDATGRRDEDLSLCAPRFRVVCLFVLTLLTIYIDA